MSLKPASQKLLDHADLAEKVSNAADAVCIALESLDSIGGESPLTDDDVAGMRLMLALLGAMHKRIEAAYAAEMDEYDPTP